jgi:uncharacterized membrane protein YedE/YeeE
MSFFEGYWPPWLGAIALAAVCLDVFLGTGRFLGVAGMLSRLLRPRETERLRALEGGLVDAETLARAMEEATRAEFGVACDAAPALPERSAASADRPLPVAMPRPPWSALLVFVLCVVLGGLLSAAFSGTLSIRWDLGPAYARLLAAGPGAWALLFLGGLLVGFGAQMAGGCTSGHGLSGCSRLQPASLLATMCFFGTAAFLFFVLSEISS